MKRQTKITAGSETAYLRSYLNATQRKRENHFENIRTLIEKAEAYVQMFSIVFHSDGHWYIYDTSKHRYQLVDRTDVMIHVDKHRLLTRRMKDAEGERGFNNLDDTLHREGHILKALERTGRKHQPKSLPKHFVQFGATLVNISTGEKFSATPDYFVINSIPWELGESDATPQMDAIFESWVGKDFVQTLYELIAYCCLSDYPIQCAFFLVGNGSNGKSKFLELLCRLIGEHNYCSTDLEQLVENKFGKAALYNKTACIVGDADHRMLTNTYVFKQLTGEDSISFEFKHKQAFTGRNYAKLVIAANSLPRTSDKTHAFYRRTNVIEFPNTFTGKLDVLASIPEHEYNNLATKCSKLLGSLLKERQFTNARSVEEMALAYQDRSEPIGEFIRTKCVEKPNSTVSSACFYAALKTHLTSKGLRVISSTATGIWMRDAGYNRYTKSITKGGIKTTEKWIAGLELKCDNKTELPDNSGT